MLTHFSLYLPLSTRNKAPDENRTRNLGLGSQYFAIKLQMQPIYKQVTGLEPVPSRWQREILPLNYTCTQNKRIRLFATSFPNLVSDCTCTWVRIRFNFTLSFHLTKKKDGVVITIITTPSLMHLYT